MKNLKISAIITLAVMAIIGGCNKAKENPFPGDKNPRVAVKLNSHYLPAGKVDSAIVTWNINGQIQQERMQVSGDTLFTEISKLSKGSGRLTIQLFSSVQLRQQNLQWEKGVDATLKDVSMNITAPVDIDDPAWFPRVIMIDPPTKFTAIVALRPADPYFLLKNVPTGYKIELERKYAAVPGGAVIVGSGLWKCNAVCTDARGIIENREFFSGLPSQIGQRQWKMVEIGIGLFGSGYTTGPNFYFNHY